jgi:hypothetical protein
MSFHDPLATCSSRWPSICVSQRVKGTGITFPGCMDTELDLSYKKPPGVKCSIVYISDQI